MFKKIKILYVLQTNLYINKAKFENSYLQGLIILISKIYNKNVEFNIINLKYFYLNSEIYTQPLVLKLRKRRDVLMYLKDLIRKAKLKDIKLVNKSNNFFTINNFDNNEKVNNLIEQTKTNTKYLKKIVLNILNIKEYQVLD